MKLGARFRIEDLAQQRAEIAARKRSAKRIRSRFAVERIVVLADGFILFLLVEVGELFRQTVAEAQEPSVPGL